MDEIYWLSFTTHIFGDRQETDQMTDSFSFSKKLTKGKKNRKSRSESFCDFPGVLFFQVQKKEKK